MERYCSQCTLFSERRLVKGRLCAEWLLAPELSILKRGIRVGKDVVFTLQENGLMDPVSAEQILF